MGPESDREWSTGCSADDGIGGCGPRRRVADGITFRVDGLRAYSGIRRPAGGNRCFSGEAQSGVFRAMSEYTHQSFDSDLSAAGFSFAIVVSRFNSFVTDPLLAGALDALAQRGADLKQVEVVRV